ncbi:MAG TPA: hypothetical protein VK215_03750 [Acidimicrobiales bacterium]|nr:hypothetical protein [Acidimicrobiales bacterium]
MDAYFMHKRLKQRLARRGGTVCQCVVDMCTYRRQFGVARHLCRSLVHGQEQILPAGPQIGDLRAELGESRPALGLGQRAGFKRPEVALDGLFGLGCLGVGEGQLLLMTGALAFSPVPGSMNCPFDEVAALIGSAQGSEDGVVHLLGREPLCVAVGDAVALAGETRVVAIPVAVSHR